MTSPDRRRIRCDMFIFFWQGYSVDISRLQKKNAVSEYYDTSDPFIDDSELAIDQRQFFAQTKQQGFYVSSGEVALLKDKYVFRIGLHTFFLTLSYLELPRNLNPKRFHL
jgi:hypothetical protein